MHTFCESCLLSDIPAHSIAATCPLCDQPSILPPGGVTALQVNNHTGRLLAYIYILLPYSTFEILLNLSMHQCLTYPTYISGYSLDLICCRYHSSFQFITDFCKSDLIIDHILITCRLVLLYSTFIEKKFITY